jgi:hypothetical protein
VDGDAPSHGGVFGCLHLMMQPISKNKSELMNRRLNYKSLDHRVFFLFPIKVYRLKIPVTVNYTFTRIVYVGHCHVDYLSHARWKLKSPGSPLSPWAKPEHTSCPNQAAPGCPGHSGAPSCPNRSGAPGCPNR